MGDWIVQLHAAGRPPHFVRVQAPLGTPPAEIRRAAYARLHPGEDVADPLNYDSATGQAICLDSLPLAVLELVR